MKYHKISFCTVCMNRKNHIQHTLLKNIQDNIDYPSIEFVLLDYSSTDQLGEWVEENLKEYIEQGILKYFRLEGAKYFNRSHSRNLAFQLSTGDIICNIDADNYTGKGFATYVNTQLQSPANYLVADYNQEKYYIRDVVGRVCLHRHAFENVRGYNEEMEGYGFEDNDFYQRLKLAGNKEIVIENIEFLNAIQHDDIQRVGNEKQANEIQGFFVNYIAIDESEVFVLYKDFTFKFSKIFPNQDHNPVHILENNQWEEGVWNIAGQCLTFISSTIQYFQINDKDKSLTNDVKKFYKIENQKFLDFLKIQLALISNQAIMNQAKPVNPIGFGEAKNIKTLPSILSLV